MTPQETGTVLVIVASACPSMRMEASTPDVWHAILGHLDAADAREAVIRLGRRNRYIAPAEVIAEVKTIREERIDRASKAEPPAVDPDNTRDYSRMLRAGLAAVAAGRDVNRAIAGPTPPRTPPPAELRTDEDRARVAALGVPCPHCDALVREWCVVPRTSRRPDGGVHPARIEALAKARAVAS